VFEVYERRVHCHVTISGPSQAKTLRSWFAISSRRKWGIAPRSVQDRAGTPVSTCGMRAPASGTTIIQCKHYAAIGGSEKLLAHLRDCETAKSRTACPKPVISSSHRSV